MKANYVVGVDGGNSKTDYFLFDLQGTFMHHIRSGTCSHEQFADGYERAYQVMNEQIGALLAQSGLSLSDVSAGAFGLAGADISSQKRELNRVIERIGFTNYAMDNDSFLGIKAGSEKGYGICSINGSGVCTGGISPSGRRLQIGGVGSELAGDEGGGFYLTRRVIRAVYDEFYRLGPRTAMTNGAMRLLGAHSEEDFMERAVEGLVARTLPYTELVTLLLEAAEGGDAAASGIVDHSARQLALSTAGCINRLDFSNETIDIVMAGSVWVKAASPVMRERYKQLVAELAERKREYRFIVLKVPPAAGAVLWALELAHGGPVNETVRRNVIAALQ